MLPLRASEFAVQFLDRWRAIFLPLPLSRSAAHSVDITESSVGQWAVKVVVRQRPCDVGELQRLTSATAAPAPLQAGPSSQHRRNLILLRRRCIWFLVRVRYSLPVVSPARRSAIDRNVHFSAGLPRWRNAYISPRTSGQVFNIFLCLRFIRKSRYTISLSKQNLQTFIVQSYNHCSSPLPHLISTPTSNCNVEQRHRCQRPAP